MLVMMIRKKIHCISWEKLCLSKEDGGLGFKDIGNFNQALLAKQAWRLYNQPGSLLAKLYKGRYYASLGFMKWGKGYRPSYAWRSILFGRKLLEEGMIWSIGNRVDIYIWSEKWIMDSHPRCAVNKECNIEETRRVASLIDVSGRWDMNAFNLPFPSNEVYRIQKLTPYIWSDKWIMDSHPRCTVNKECNIEVTRRVASLIDVSVVGIWVHLTHSSLPTRFAVFRS